MAEKPILFSGEMVRAILEGRKTQTRRVMKPQPFEDKSYVGGFGWPYSKNSSVAVGAPHIGGYCPYGHWEGGRLWVRETWACHRELDEVVPRDCIGSVIWYLATQENKHPDIGKTRPSIFMPQWASRIMLQITNVRVERVQDITDDDAIEEGVSRANTSIPGYASTRFAKLWDSINAKRGFSWSSNPWVWVISFQLAAPQPRLAPDPASCANQG